MEDYIVAGILIVIIGAVIAYLVKAKKKGAKCIGCPCSCGCNKKDCGSKTKKKGEKK